MNKNQNFFTTIKKLKSLRFSKKTQKIITIFSILIIFSYSVLVFTDVLWIKNPNQTKYPIIGVDVSHFQGDINWEKLSKQKIDKQQIKFAFIKATEGSKSVDYMFQTNWTNAAKTPLIIGAYHFFSFDSRGAAQAKNFIANVPFCAGTLPPVIDIEFYGNKSKNPPSASAVHKNLDEYIKVIEEYYKCKPIIYTTYSFYNKYIKDYYSSNYPIWIRNVYFNPSIIRSLKWTFWQYSSTKKLPDCYKSEEEDCIDVNIFNGNIQDLKDLCISY